MLERLLEQFPERFKGAMLLDPHTYEDVEADHSATMQAVLVVIIVAVAAGIGGLSGGISGLIIGIVSAVVQWVLWAFVTLILGTTIFNTPETHADWGQLARTTGFAQAPGILRIFGFIPVLGPVIVLVSFVWQIVAMVVAVRHALDYTSTKRAVGVVILSIGTIIVVVLVGVMVIPVIITNGP